MLPLLAAHGGRLERRLRALDDRAEVHVLSFDSDAGYSSFLNDPRRAAARATIGDRKPPRESNCWVVASIVVQLPFLSRPVCLPVLVRLWRPRHTGKIAHARVLAELIAARYPDRRGHVVGDAAYVGERLRDVDGRISWTSRLKVTSVLHELPPPCTWRSGRPRTRGARVGTPADVAALATTMNTWRTIRSPRHLPRPCPLRERYNAAPRGAATNDHRPHPTLGQGAPSRSLPRRRTTELHTIQRCDRLSGLIHEYQQVA